MTPIPYDWPPLVSREGNPLPESVKVTTGCLVVPSDLPPGQLAPMDQYFRHRLWPPCAKLGYKRYSRQFVWTDDGRVLHFRIVDIPVGTALKEERVK